MNLVPMEIEGQDDDCGNLRSFYRAICEGGTPYPSLRDGACRCNGLCRHSINPHGMHYKSYVIASAFMN